jgi:hypothetical protein
MQKLFDFFLTDRIYRFKTYAVCSLVAILYALVSVFALHKDEKEVSLETVVVLYSLVILCIAYYVLVRQEKPQHATPVKSRGLLRPVVAIAVCVAIFLIVASVTEPEVIAAQLQAIASQPEPVFQSNLVLFERTVRAATSKKVKSDPNLLNTLAQKLAQADSTQPNYWAALVEFLNYRNQSLPPDLLAKLENSRDSTPRCTDKRPSPPVIIGKPSPNTVQVHAAFYENCRVALDNPEDQARINFLLETLTGLLEFRNSLIEYHGGSIQIDLHQDADNPSRGITTLIFTNCLFDFSLHGNPPADAQEVLKILLLNQNGNLVVPPGATITPIS